MEAEGGIGGGSSRAAPRWAVRIRRGDGTVAGAGVLVDPEWVLTCAAAVSPGERVTAEFVGAGGASRHARADEVCPSEAGGVALLRLDRSGPAGAAGPLRRLSVPGRRVRMYGFPAADGAGAWVAAATEPMAAAADGRVRLAVTLPVAPGYGGAGVTDAATGELVGVALPGEQDAAVDPRPYLSPAETIVHHLPRAAGWTRGRAAVDERLHPVQGAQLGMFDPYFARRLADWFRGDGAGKDRAVGQGHPLRRRGDGRQVKISRVRTDDPVRAATLRRTLVLADRELRGPARGTAETDPPLGGLDLAVDAAGRPTPWIAELVADRLGVFREGPGALAEHAEAGPQAPDARILVARTTLTLVVVGVDEAADPDTLLDLLAMLRLHGDRMLLVFRRDGEYFARAQSQLVIEPSQQRQAELIERLAWITGPLADELHARMAEVRADCARALAGLMKAQAVRTTMDGTMGIVAGLGQDPDLGRYERVVARAERRMTEAVDRLRRLIERRDELVGRLGSYQVLHQQTAGSEDLAAEDRYLAAYELLDARPCDVAAAETAMRDYVDFVEEQGRGRPPREGGPAR